MWRILLQQSPTAQAWSRRLQTRSWALKWTLFFTAAVMTIPVIILVLTGLLVAAVTFVIFSLAAKVMELVGASPTGVARSDEAGVADIGRRNVRVIRDDS